MMMKLLKILFFVCMFLFIFLFSFYIAFFDNGFYKKQFEVNNVYDVFGGEKVDSVKGELIGYFNGDNELATGLFNEKEKMHLEDVKGIIGNVLGMFYIVAGLGCLMLVYFLMIYDDKAVASVLIGSGSVALGVIVVLVLITVLDFNWLFTGFHLIAFDNRLWLLPGESNLVRMFPAGFFLAMFIRILLYAGVFGLTFIIIGFVSRKYHVLDLDKYKRKLKAYLL